MLDAHFAIKANVNLGLIFGEDNTERGMKYYTFLIEPIGQIEYFFLSEGRGFGSTSHMRYKPIIRPYLYAGGGPLFFFPSHYHEDAVELESFSNYTLILVGGIGLRHRINADWFWGFQVGGRLSSMVISTDIRPRVPMPTMPISCPSSSFPTGSDHLFIFSGRLDIVLSCFHHSFRGDFLKQS